MAKAAGDFLFERLRVWNVKRVFGYPDDGINGLVTAAKYAKRWRSRVTVGGLALRDIG